MNYSTAKDVFRTYRRSGRTQKFIFKKKRILEKNLDNYFS